MVNLHSTLEKVPLIASSQLRVKTKPEISLPLLGLNCEMALTAAVFQNRRSAQLRLSWEVVINIKR